MIAVSLSDRFLFNTITGSIQAYNLVPYTDKKYAELYSKDKGEIFFNNGKFKRKILKDWVKDDPESFSLWKKHRRTKLIYRTACPYGFMAAGLTASVFISKNNKDLGGAVGISSLFFPMLFYLVPPIHPSEIVEKYNASKRKNEKFFYD